MFFFPEKEESPIDLFWLARTMKMKTAKMGGGKEERVSVQTFDAVTMWSS
jgi:hypothetical protein